MTDGLSGFRGRSVEEAERLQEAFSYLEQRGLDDTTIRFYDLGVEARERLNTDRVLRAIFESVQTRIEDAFHEWLHTDDHDELLRLHGNARASKNLLDDLQAIIRTADEIESQIANEGDTL